MIFQLLIGCKDYIVNDVPLNTKLYNMAHLIYLLSAAEEESTTFNFGINLK